VLRRFFPALPNCKHRLVMFAAVRSATVRGCGVRSGVGATAASASVRRRWAGSTIGGIGASTGVSASRDVPASATAAEAMSAPAVAIAPVRPRANAQEDAVIEIARPIKTTGRAAVRRIVIVAVGTDRWIYADADSDLCAGHWHQGQGYEQSYRSGQKQSMHCEFASPGCAALDLRHFFYPPEVSSAIERYVSSIGPWLTDNWSIEIVIRNIRLRSREKRES
jgi:hypothetical protein